MEDDYKTIGDDERPPMSPATLDYENTKSNLLLQQLGALSTSNAGGGSSKQNTPEDKTSSALFISKELDQPPAPPSTRTSIVMKIKKPSKTNLDNRFDKPLLDE
jgi:hypothetical protein